MVQNEQQRAKDRNNYSLFYWYESTLWSIHILLGGSSHSTLILISKSFGTRTCNLLALKPALYHHSVMTCQLSCKCQTEYFLYRKICWTISGHHISLTKRARLNMKTDLESQHMILNQLSIHCTRLSCIVRDTFRI